MLQVHETHGGHSEANVPAPGTSQSGRAWCALWTHSHCEETVYHQLIHKGLGAFLPKVDVWSKRRGVRHLIRVPMFPGYLFLHHSMDKQAYLELHQVRGLVRVLGQQWDRLIAIPDDEIETIRTVVASHQRMFPFPYLKEGQRARIASGPLAGVEGVLVQSRAKRGLLVLSVHLLQRSVAVAVDGTNVIPT